ncbi:Uma2 family endonuclease [Rhodopseudomonas palustris]|uniref:Putative restriction endonuclease domain-containing protein n=1 Tax=Rhodopseudomonas palustris (strain BisB18) TaxID=316056 RepID=Q21BP9_RHOPB
MAPIDVAVIDQHTSRMSGAEFRAFQDNRPDHERWELLGGVAMMMTPPTLVHNQIASNLQQLLNDALERHDSSRLAAQRPGLELASGDYKPEPDIAVIDADFKAGQRFVEKAYLLAEIVSATDDVAVPGTVRSWIDVKRELYRSHVHCLAVLIVSQDRMKVELDLKTESGWVSSVLEGPTAELSIAAFSLRGPVGALYVRTPLAPRRS